MLWRVTRFTVSSLAAVVATVAVACSVACAADDRSPVDNDRLRAHMERIASDETEGRGLGQPGLDRAISYAVAVFESVGLTPGYEREGEPSALLQPVPFVRYRYHANTTLTIDGPGYSRVLAHGDEMIVFHPGRSLSPPPPGVPVFVGYGIHEPAMGHDDYADIQTDGRWIVVMEGVPQSGSDSLRNVYSDPVQGPPRQYDAALQHGVAGIVGVLSPQEYAYWDVILRVRREQSIAAARDYAGGELRDPILPVIALRRDILSELFDGTEYDPVERVGKYSSFELAGHSITLSVDAERDELVSYNVVGLVPGSDPRLRDEVVVASAHIDHLGIIAGEIHNGANDDASGCAAILEAARIIAAEPLKRSVLFVLFTAEESEHLGSLHFLAEPPPPGKRIVANINLEHVGRSNDGTFLATASEPLQRLVAKVRASHEDRLRTAELDEHGRNIRGSDSYSFFLHDIPIIIFGGGGFPEYHSPGDDIENIDFELLSDAAAITVDLLREVCGAADI